MVIVAHPTKSAAWLNESPGLYDIAGSAEWPGPQDAAPRDAKAPGTPSNERKNTSVKPGLSRTPWLIHPPPPPNFSMELGIWKEHPRKWDGFINPGSTLPGTRGSRACHSSVAHCLGGEFLTGRTSLQVIFGLDLWPNGAAIRGAEFFPRLLRWNQSWFP